VKIIKCKDYYFVKDEINWFTWFDSDDDNLARLLVGLKSKEVVYINGPKTLLGQFSKQMEEEK